MITRSTEKFSGCYETGVRIFGTNAGYERGPFSSFKDNIHQQDIICCGRSLSRFLTSDAREGEDSCSQQSLPWLRTAAVAKPLLHTQCSSWGTCMWLWVFNPLGTQFSSHLEFSILSYLSVQNLWK